MVVMSIGGNFQLVEHARMFEDNGVIYVEPRQNTRVAPIRAAGNRYNLVTLNPDGNFTLEQVTVGEALSLGDRQDRQKFMKYAGCADLVTVGVSDGVLKSQQDAQIWLDLAEFIYHASKSHRDITAPFLSTDNAFNNGLLMHRNIVAAVATHPYSRIGHDTNLIELLTAGSPFMCNCVVDRMVMGKPGEKALPILKKMGIDPTMLTVYTEPIPRVSNKLVVEDLFAMDNLFIVGGLPPEERAKLVNSTVFPYAVAKYEAMNFFHTAQVHWGYVAGLIDVHEDLQHPVLGAYIRRAATEKARIVSGYDFFNGTGIDVVALANEFTDRCNNPFLGHRNEFIVRNGTGKIAERVAGSLRATHGQVDNGMYGTIASIIREKTPIKKDGEQYIGRKDNCETYTIEDTDPFIMKAMIGVDRATSRTDIDSRVGKILEHIGLSGLDPRLQQGVTALVYDLMQRPAMEVLKDYSARCFN